MLLSIVVFISENLSACKPHIYLPLAAPGGDTEENIGSDTADIRLVLIYHDKSSFHASEGQSWQWAEENMLALRPKSQGRGLMIRDFIDEHSGFLSLSTEDSVYSRTSPLRVNRNLGEVEGGVVTG